MSTMRQETSPDTITLPIVQPSSPTMGASSQNESTGNGSRRRASMHSSSSKSMSKVKAPSISRNAVLISAPRKPDSYRRSRTLKRGVQWVPLADEHLKYLWAAYKRGSFDPAEFLTKDLDIEAFRLAVLEFVGRVFQGGGEAFVFLGKTSFGIIPIGLALLKIMGNYAEPHIIWFPEASPRNKLEATLASLVKFKQDFKLLLWVRERNWKLYAHLCKYGAIRTVGKYKGFFPDGENAFLFQGVR